MRLPFDQFRAFLAAATKLVVCLTVACLAIACGLALLGFSDVVANVQEWTLKGAIASAAAFAFLVIAWISGQLARRIEGQPSVSFHK